MQPDLASLIQSYTAALERGDAAAAQEAVDAAIEVAPFDAEAWGCRGEFYRHYGRDLEEALACFQRASLLDPSCHLGPGCCAAVLEDLQQPWAALEAWGEAIAKAPGHPDLRLARAALRDRCGEFSEAREDLAEALALAPAEVDAHCLLGEVLLREQRYCEAEAAFAGALRVARGHERALEGRSVALGALGQVAAANQTRGPRQGELVELSRVVEGERVWVRFRVRPGQDALALKGLAAEWLASLESSRPGYQEQLWCGWALELVETPGGLLLAEYDLERGPWRAPVIRPEATMSLEAETAGRRLRADLGWPGWQLDLTESARMCPRALARPGDLRLVRVEPEAPGDSGWRIGPLEAEAFRVATRPERFRPWPPLLFLLEEARVLLPYLTLAPGLALEVRGGRLVSVQDTRGQERLAA